MTLRVVGPFVDDRDAAGPHAPDARDDARDDVDRTAQWLVAAHERSVPTGSGVHVPGIDMERLAALRADMGSDDVVLTFLRRWADMVEERMTRLSDALREQDGEGATVVAASLRVTSAMAGATAVSRLCAGLERQVAEGRFAAAGALLPELTTHTRRAQDGARQLIATLAA